MSVQLVVVSIILVGLILKVFYMKEEILVLKDMIADLDSRILYFEDKEAWEEEV